MMQISLNGEWKFREAQKGVWLSAEVPGCNYLDLLHAEKIPDPFVGLNEKEVYWVAETDWEYERTFTVPAELLDCDRVELQCATLDTICDVFVNDTLVGKGENAHRRYAFDVKSALKAGENRIRILFYSPVNYVKAKQEVEKCPRNSNGMDGIPHIRKPQCHFGWDWGPVLPPSGISGDIGIFGYSGARITDLLIEQHHADGKVRLSVSSEIEYLSERSSAYVLRILSPAGDLLTETCGVLEKPGCVNLNEEIENPELWWTRDLSDKPQQPLYTVTFELLCGDAVMDSVTKKIGLRTIELNREKDEFGENFQFRINGVPLFIKGANWIPPDSFATRYTDARMEYDMAAMRFSNFNMLRIWGGGYYERDALYDKCDRDGILIWQDFCFACQGYPFFDEALLENIHGEVVDNVRRLRHHACLALWNGNNEIETMSIAWQARRKYIDWAEKFFYHILPEWLEKLDAQTPYIPGSPCGTGYLQGVDRDGVGDTHLWAVWHGLQPLTYYRRRMTRFCSEFGFESLPDQKTIARYAAPADYDLNSAVFLAHQKCAGGNMKMAFYIASRFRLPKHFTDYVYLSQICQEECVRDATEYWRRNKGRCNGSMYWQFNDCWPVCSWAGLDYYGNYKALQYAARHFNAPFTVSVEDTKERLRVFVLNDTRQDRRATLSWRLLGFDGEQFASEKKSISVGALQNEIVFDLPVSRLSAKGNLKRAVFVAELKDGEALLARRTVLFDKEKNLALPKTQVDMHVRVSDGAAQIELTAKRYTRFLQVHSKSNLLPFSDNFFDLLPGETKRIVQPVRSGVTAEQVKNDLELFSAGDIVPRASRLSDALTRASVFLKPLSIGNFIYYQRIPK